MNLRELVFNLRLKLYRIIPVKKNRIVFISHLGKTYACNPRYLCEYLAREFHGKYELIWVYDKQASRQPDLPPGVKAAPYFSHKCMRLIATAGIIVSNTRISDTFYFKKRSTQFYLQTWHSSMRLKCIEADGNLGEIYEEFAKRDSAKIDLIISGGSFSSRIFRNSFWYSGEIAETGTPRIDWMRNQNEVSKTRILSKANLNRDTHYLLYAPTFRKDGSKSAYNVDFHSLTNCLKNKFGGEWKILYRLHPNLKGKTKADVNLPYILDMTDYDDIQELLVVSDILMTDYSSSMFDAALSNKICILYMADLEKYLEKERTLYFDINTLPFPLAKNNDELISLITQFDNDRYERDLSDFMRNIGSCETGRACEQIESILSTRI